MAEKIDDYHTHEALDRTFIVMEMLSYVTDHPAVQRNAEWKHKADKAHDVLWELYQMIGAEHLR